MYIIQETNWEVRETPLYKLKTQGAKALSDVEILASLAYVNEKQSRACLTYFNSLQRIARASLAELKQVPSINQKAAMSILCAFELARRKQGEISKKPQILDSRTVAAYLQALLADQSQEVFAVLFLNRRNEVEAEEILFKGGVAVTVVDPKIIFKAACNYLASGIILAHTHPSGNLQPSEADKKLTQYLKKAGELLEIRLLDHLIITDQNYFSFADEGLI